jgi:predicted ATP-dependent endonuclease of OLD family
MFDVRGVYFNGYKSFGLNSFAEIPNISNMNVLIGKNNSGKSSVLDIINYIIDIDQYEQNKNRVSCIDLVFKLSDEDVSDAFMRRIFGNESIDKLLRIQIDTYNYGAISYLPLFIMLSKAIMNQQ